MKKNFNFPMIVALLTFFTSVTAQNKSVSIGSLTPDNSAILDLESVSQGFLMTRLDSSQIKLILSPANGLIAFNTQDQCFWFKKKVKWVRICSTDSLINNYINTNYLKSDTAIINYLKVNYAKLDTIINTYLTSKTIKTDSLYINGTPIQTIISDSLNTYTWLLKGNKGTNPVNNFIGTLDPIDWIIKTNDAERMRVLAGGNIGIGVSNPLSLLSVGKGKSHFRVDSNGVTYLENGTALLPQLAFINDNTTGLYRPSANDFGVSVSGTTGIYLNGLNQNMYYGFIGSYTNFGPASQGNIALGDAQMSGSYNFSFGGRVSGAENICLETSYTSLASSIAGQSCVEIGTINKINAVPGAGPSYIFGNNNTINTAANGSSGFIIGTSNSFSANNNGIAFLFGSLNTALTGATSSIAIGGLITLEHPHNLALSDWGTALTTQRSNQMIASFSNGYQFYSNAPQTTGVTLAPGGGSWASTSDRNQKENFRQLNTEDILIKFCSLPVTEWSYISQRVTELNQFKTQPIHIGVMAQDFNSAFGYGEFDNRITQTDIDGVLSALIKALYEKSKQIDILKKEIDQLKIAVSKLMGRNSGAAEPK